MRGGLWVGESLMTRLMTALAGSAPGTAAPAVREDVLAPLTAREREIADLVLAGRNNKEISSATGLSKSRR